MRRKDMAKQERFTLKGEDIKEDFELTCNVAQGLVQELTKTINNRGLSAKAAEANANGMFDLSIRLNNN
jgi:hypothetical protein